MTYKKIQEVTDGINSHSISCYTIYISYSKTG